MVLNPSIGTAVEGPAETHGWAATRLDSRRRHEPLGARQAHFLHAPGEPCESKHCPPDDDVRYRLHDFFQWNKSRAWWDEEREKAAKRKAALPISWRSSRRLRSRK